LENLLDYPELDPRRLKMSTRNQDKRVLVFLKKMREPPMELRVNPPPLPYVVFVPLKKLGPKPIEVGEDFLPAEMNISLV
jgi:hypothetical protein